MQPTLIDFMRSHAVLRMKRCLEAASEPRDSYRYAITG